MSARTRSKALALLTVVMAMAGAAMAQDHSAPTPAVVPAAALDLPALRSALAAARAGDRTEFLAAVGRVADPDAKRLATWAFVDTAGEQLSFAEIDAARRELAGWPRAGRREELAERAIAGAGLSPAQINAWFAGREPETPQGAMALAAAFQGLAEPDKARALIKRFWRERLFDADAEQAMLAAFGGYLDADDHIRRLDALLLGPQGPAAQVMLPLVPADWRALAQARMDLRADRPDALEHASDLPPSVSQDPGLALEEARWLRAKNRMDEGFALLSRFPVSAPHEDGQARLYAEARQYFVEALQRGDFQAAYAVMAARRFPPGALRAEAEFFAGWVALTKLKDPAAALAHFEALRESGQSPLTRSRAFYWLGRAAEAEGQAAIAEAYYRQGAQYVFAFYGQLCAEKAGMASLTLPPETGPTAAEQVAFEARPVVRAARILQDLGETDLFKVFLSQLAASAAGKTDFAQLIDLARTGGQPFTAMMIGRTAASRGLYLPERMYPLESAPPAEGAPETAFTLAIARQESSFDPRARTASARGVMMLRPETARDLARRLGMPYTDAMLWDADYNLRLGSIYLGQMVARMGGSYLLAAAAYNAGPNRFPRWTTLCGDPRAGGDPIDFIECVPFGETRDYMMRVMENLQVYRARLGGGTGPLRLEADLRRAAAAE